MFPIRPLMMRNNGTNGTAGTAGYLTAESLTETSFTAASSDIITVSGATLKANTDYFMFVSVDAKSDTTASNALLNIYLNGSAQNVMSPNYVSESVGTDYRNLHFIRKITTGSVTSPDVWTVQLARGSAATITWKNARIVFLQVGANDKYAESRAHTFWNSPTSDTLQTAASLTDTFSGDYLILGFAVVDKVNSTNTNFLIEMTDGTTVTGAARVRAANTSDRISVTVPVYVTGLSGSKTYSLQMREDGSGGTTIGVADAAIIAIKLNRFAHVYHVADTTGSGSTTSTYTAATGADQTFTPTAGNHFTLAGGMFEGFSAGTTAQCRYDDNGTTVNDPATPGNITFDNAPFLSPRIANYTATSRRQKLDLKVSSGSAAVYDGFIFTFDLAGI
jgi:hypothetical protein